ncbi:MAG: HK97 gp10 family phage protein [Lentisphaeria bacterium]|nr:HK97 gp10 family phage protein [Lentisphaeria bacterium]
MSVKFTSYASQVIDNIEQKKQVALEIIGGKAETYAKQLCPVDTGNLRNSITHQRAGKDTEAVGTNVEYAPYVELGHHTASGKKVPGRPFLRPAAEDHGQEYQEIMKKIMGI